MSPFHSSFFFLLSSFFFARLCLPVIPSVVEESLWPVENITYYLCLFKILRQAQYDKQAVIPSVVEESLQCETLFRHHNSKFNIHHSLFIASNASPSFRAQSRNLYNRVRAEPSLNFSFLIPHFSFCGQRPQPCRPFANCWLPPADCSNSKNNPDRHAPVGGVFYYSSTFGKSFKV